MNKRTSTQGLADGTASGVRVPRHHDYFDLVNAGNYGGPEYAQEFCRGVDKSAAPEGDNDDH